MRSVIMVLLNKRSVYRVIFLVIFLLSIPIILVFIGKKDVKNINTNKYSEYELKGDSIILKNKKEISKIKVFITEENRVEEMNLEDYVRGVLSGEMPVSFETEALKAQAVAARTYAVSKMADLKGKPCELHKMQGADICDTVHCQVYKTKDERFRDWGAKEAESNWSKITEVVMATGGQVLSFNGELAKQALYFSSSSGKTEEAMSVFAFDVPYLKSVVSVGEEQAPKYITKTTMSLKELTDKINSAYPKAQISLKKIKTQIQIINRNSGDTVNDLKIGNETIKGKNFRELLNLNSANFQLKFLNNDVEITCYGYGHDVGMSQWGANVMAKNGRNYLEILTHYYTGVSVKQLNEVNISEEN
jgi:stage II sporulation protein D